MKVVFKNFFSKFDYIELILKILSLVVLLTFTHFIISYSKGEIRLPFFGTINNYNSNVSAEKENEQNDTVQNTVAEPINLRHITNPDVFTETIIPENDIALNSGEKNELFPYFTEEMKNEGYSISHRNYEKDKHDFYRIDLSENELVPDVLDVTTDDNIIRRAVQVEMGYIFVYHDDGNGEVLNSSGEKIIGNLKYRALQLVYHRDKHGNPVFLNGTNYRIYDEEQKRFVETDFNPIVNNRGVYFSYSKYFGYPVNSNLTRFYDSAIKKWGYKNVKTDETVVDAVYDEAYNFNNGYAVAIRYEYKNKKRLHFLDEEGNVLNSDYFAPDIVGKSNLGFLYFENGITRALYREYHWNSTILEEKAYLCYADGTIFSIPTDYTVQAYSDGIIMLEKGGKYGFMDSRGNWIIQPIYTYASPFNEGVAVVGLSETQKALVDTKGNLITNFEFSHITDCSGGVVALYSDEHGWVIVNKMNLS